MHFGFEEYRVDYGELWFDGLQILPYFESIGRDPAPLQLACCFDTVLLAGKVFNPVGSHQRNVLL